MSARPLGGNLVGMASTTPSALVAGAGVGGLAAAVALQRAGVSVTVVERSPRLEAPGAGLSVGPNAVLALRDLEAAGAVQRLEIPRAATGLRRWDGVPLAVDDPAELEGRYGAPLVLVHRAELQQALLAAFGAGTLVLGEQVVHVRQDEAGVTAGLSGGRTLRADVLIGADGLRSVVRSAVLGDEPPSYSGLVAFRGVIEGMDVAPAGEFWGPHAVFGVAPLSHGRAYWYATRRVDDPEAPPPAAVDDLEQ